MALSVITQPSNNKSLVGNLVVFRVSTANSAIDVLAEVSINGNSFVYRATPDAGLVAEFRIEAALAAGLAANTLPNFATNTTTIGIDSYSIDITQTPDQILQTDREALAGGFRQWQYPSREPTFFETDVTLLTEQPQGKIIGASQKEYLYFVTSLGSVDVELDGVLVHTIVTTSTNIYAIDVSPARFGLTSGSYTVSLSGNTSQSYRIDVENRVYSREYLYQNSLGVWEVLRTTGRREIRESGKAQEAVVRLPYDYSQNTGRKVAFNIDPSTMYKQFGGYKDKPIFEYLAWQLASTERIYEILDDNSLLPYLIKKRDFKLKQNATGLQGFVLELEVAY